MRLLCALLLTAGCAHTDDLTAAENRNEASLHRARGVEEQRQFDPNQTQQPQRQVSRANDPAMLTPEFSYNPTEGHQFAADAEFRKANEHLRAANKLESFEDEACRDISAGERASCPLLGSYVSEVRHTSKGFQLAMKPTVDVDDVTRRLSCHLAYARTTGFERPSCPLFVRGTSIRRVGEAIAFEGDTRDIALVLQTQADRVFARR